MCDKRLCGPVMMMMMMMMVVIITIIATNIMIIMMMMMVMMIIIIIITIIIILMIMIIIILSSLLLLFIVPTIMTRKPQIKIFCNHLTAPRSVTSTYAQVSQGAVVWKSRATQSDQVQYACWLIAQPERLRKQRT